jgi:hypothetical protein
VASGGVLGYVGFLVLEVFFVADSVFEVAWMPDFAFVLLADGVGEAAFDELDGARECVFWRWSDYDVDVVGHDGECVELVAVLGSMAEEGLLHEVGVCGAGENRAAPMGQDGQGVGLHG